MRRAATSWRTDQPVFYHLADRPAGVLPAHHPVSLPLSQLLPPSHTISGREMHKRYKRKLRTALGGHWLLDAPASSEPATRRSLTRNKGRDWLAKSQYTASSFIYRSSDATSSRISPSKYVPQPVESYTVGKVSARIEQQSKKNSEKMGRRGSKVGKRPKKRHFSRSASRPSQAARAGGAIFRYVVDKTVSDRGV